MIAAGQVGLLVVSDFDRLGPSSKDLVIVLHLCQKADTLVAVDGCIVDWHEPVYLRHSTRRQCGHHAGRTKRQREHAAVFGWPASTITPIDSVESNGKTPVEE